MVKGCIIYAFQAIVIKIVACGNHKIDVQLFSNITHLVVKQDKLIRVKTRIDTWETQHYFQRWASDSSSMIYPNATKRVDFVFLTQKMLKYNEYNT